MYMKQHFRTMATFLFFIAGIVIIVATLVLIAKERKRAHAIDDVISSLEQQKEQYEHKNTQLEDRITYLQSDYSYEKEAKKLNYKKHGEHVVIVRRSTRKVDGNDGKVMGVTSEETQKKTHFSIWLSYFF